MFKIFDSHDLDKACTAISDIIVDYLKPKIILLGRWDDTYQTISNFYRWSIHLTTIPETLDQDTALVIVNSTDILEHLKKLVTPKLAILLYDKKKLAHVDFREGIETPLFCYLTNYNDRFINGHVRTLLQVQRNFIGDYIYPTLICNPNFEPLFKELIKQLDLRQNAYIRTDDLNLFKSYFEQINNLTSYCDVEVILSVDNIPSLKEQSDKTTYIIDKPLVSASMEKIKKSAGFIINDTDNSTAPNFSSSSFGYSVDDAYLIAYYISLIVNKSDIENRSRFIQQGDVLNLYKGCGCWADFCAGVYDAFDQDILRFRNTPPRIDTVLFGTIPLSKILSRFENQVYAKVIDQCNNSLHTASLLTGVRRSTLQSKTN